MALTSHPPSCLVRGALPRCLPWVLHDQVPSEDVLVPGEIVVPFSCRNIFRHEAHVQRDGLPLRQGEEPAADGVLGAPLGLVVPALGHGAQALHRMMPWLLDQLDPDPGVRDSMVRTLG